MAVPKSDQTATTKAKSGAFRETVVEKPLVPGLANYVSQEKAAVAPTRISRFKARRQGL